jgi:RecT family
MNALTKTSAPPVAPGQQGLIPHNMQEAMQLAEMMARGKMMPEHLRNPGDALMVIEQAMRWSMSPFAVAQATFSIKGKLLFAGTIVAAAIENSGAIQGLMDYQFSGEGQNLKVTVIATRRGETQPKTVEVTLKDAATANDIWKKQPNQQLVYHGSRVWARRWTPGVMLGVYTPEEWREQPHDEFNGTTLDHEPAHSPAPPVNDAIPERVMNGGPKPAAAKPAPEIRRSPNYKWLAALHDDLSKVTDEDELNAIENDGAVKDALKNMRNGDLLELKAMLAETFARLKETPHDPETGEIDDGFPGDK